MRRLLGVLAAAVLALAIPVPAQAIQGPSEIDTEHDEVAMTLWVDSQGLRFRCSATLISDRVLLTAGHCTDDVVGKHIVTFTNPATPPGPSPGAGGYDESNVPSGYVTGEATPHPLWTGQLRLKDLYDVGVIVLDEPFTGVEPAELPPRAGWLDEFTVRQLKAELFTLVGYGVYFEKPDTAPKAPTAVSDLTRRFTTAPLQNIQGPTIKLAASENDSRGGGGTCFGDSGGAIYWGGYLVGDTSFGASPYCRGMGGYQRVDDPEVYPWVMEFVTNPH